MPGEAAPQVGERVELAARFLDAVLAEVRQAVLRRLPQLRRVDLLGGADEDHRIGRATGARRGGRQPAPHRGESLRKALQVNA